MRTRVSDGMHFSELLGVFSCWLSFIFYTSSLPMSVGSLYDPYGDFFNSSICKAKEIRPREYSAAESTSNAD